MPPLHRTSLAALVSLALVGVPVAVAAVDATNFHGAKGDPTGGATKGKGLPVEFLVGFDGVFPSHFMNALGAKTKHVDFTVGFALVEGNLGSALAASAQGHPDVTYIELNGLIRSSSSRWDAATWDAATWDAATWDAATWDASRWDASRWDASRWDAATWDAASWDASRWDAASWDASRWDASRWDDAEIDASRWDASRWDGTAEPDPGFPMQWNLGAMHATDAWETTMGYHDRTICVVDSGIDATHPDLARNVRILPDGSFGYDFIDGDSDPTDIGGHGTHVAGIAAAVTGNGHGIAGVSQAYVIAARVLDSTGVGTDANLARGITYCADAGADIVLLALHADSSTKTVKKALDYAMEQGALVVAASGNLGLKKVAFPAKHDGVLAVGASDVDSSRAEFSNYGDDLDLLAPGVRIPGLFSEGRFAFGTGTSQAAANAAGAAALLWSAAPHLTAAEVSELLTSSAKDDGEEGFDKYYGHGHLRVDRAFAAAGVGS